MLFFQLINRRYERASTVLTSNKGFEEWGQILGDEVMAAALIDRLLHHCHIVNIRAAATGCASTPTSPRSSTRLLRSRALHPRREREQEQRRKRRTRGSSPPPTVQFSMARPVQLSMAVDKAFVGSPSHSISGRLFAVPPPAANPGLPDALDGVRRRSNVDRPGLASHAILTRQRVLSCLLSFQRKGGKNHYTLVVSGL